MKRVLCAIVLAGLTIGCGGDDGKQKADAVNDAKRAEMEAKAASMREAMMSKQGGGAPDAAKK